MNETFDWSLSMQICLIFRWFYFCGTEPLVLQISFQFNLLFVLEPKQSKSQIKRTRQRANKKRLHDEAFQDNNDKTLSSIKVNIVQDDVASNMVINRKPFKQSPNVIRPTFGKKKDDYKVFKVEVDRKTVGIKISRNIKLWFSLFYKLLRT